jgi:hypothetical protein
VQAAALLAGQTLPGWLRIETSDVNVRVNVTGVADGVSRNSLFRGLAR